MNVFDHLDSQGNPDLQAALDAARDGESIYLPGARVYQAPPGGWIIRKRVEIYGDGPGRKDVYWGTVLAAGAPNDPVFVLDAPAPPHHDLSNLYLHDFQITRPPGQAGRYGGDGIRYLPGATKKVSNVSLERVAVYHLNGSGFSLLGDNAGDGAIVDLHLLDCIAADCGGYGLALQHAFGVNLMHCLLEGNGKAGCRAASSGVALYQCTLAGNGWSETAGEASLHFLNCHTARVEGTRFLDFALGATKTACICTSSVGLASGGALVIGGCSFEVPAGAPPCTGIAVPGPRPESGPVLVLPNRYLRVSKLVDIGTAAPGEDVTGCVLFPQFDEGGGGAISVPSSPNQGLVAVPHVNRPAGNTIAGLAIPASFVGDPTLNTEDGTLAWNHTLGQLRVRVAGSWRTVARGS